MNNIEDGLKKCNIMLYADDAVLFTPSKNSSDIEEDLNLDSLYINRWFIDNNLIIQISKNYWKCCIVWNMKMIYDLHNLNMKRIQDALM